MKKIVIIYFLLLCGHCTFGQVLTLPQLKAIKDVYQPDYIQVKDAEIAYPVTGMTDIHVKFSLKGEIIVEVEVWVVDSKGKIVYNSIFAGQDLTVANFDRDYMRYMKMQNNQVIKRRHLLASHI